jgi:hypothetical protein
MNYEPKPNLPYALCALLFAPLALRPTPYALILLLPISLPQFHRINRN